MRGMSDKSLRLVLSTFSNIREELGHLQNDLTVTFILIFSFQSLSCSYNIEIEAFRLPFRNLIHYTNVMLTWI